MNKSLPSWLLLAVGENRAFGSNDGYHDEPDAHYAWDSTASQPCVANARRSPNSSGPPGPGTAPERMATDKVELGRPEKLMLGDVQRESSGHVVGLTVTVGLEDLRARREVYLYGFNDLTGFFAGLAENWRGWSGTRNYESIEHDLLLEAARTGNHVELRFTLQDPRFQDEWFVRAKLTLETGEELTRASEDIKDLFSPPPAQDL